MPLAVHVRIMPLLLRHYFIKDIYITGKELYTSSIAANYFYFPGVNVKWEEMVICNHLVNKVYCIDIQDYYE